MIVLSKDGVRAYDVLEFRHGVRVAFCPRAFDVHSILLFDIGIRFYSIDGISSNILLDWEVHTAVPGPKFRNQILLDWEVHTAVPGPKFRNQIFTYLDTHGEVVLSLVLKKASI